MSKIPHANWNGIEMPLDWVRVSAMDRGYLFGDAVYEALRIYQSKLWLADEHFARLRRSLTAIRIDCDLDRLRVRLLKTLTTSAVEEGLAYIQVSRGQALRTHHFPKEPLEPNELIYIQDVGGDPYADDRAIGVNVITHPDTRWERRDIKSVNLLANCLASQAAHEADCIEAVFYDEHGFVTEGTHMSVFAVRDGHVVTAPKGHHILPGITRELVLSLAERLGIPHDERSVHKDDLTTVDEVFLTGTTSEVLPVVRVDGRAVGDGMPGPITQSLYQAYQAEVEQWAESVVVY